LGQTLLRIFMMIEMCRNTKWTSLMSILGKGIV